MQSTAMKRVVIVGGGVAGTLAVKLLEDFADVTLIDPYTPFAPFLYLRLLKDGCFKLGCHLDYISKRTTFKYLQTRYQN